MKNKALASFIIAVSAAIDAGGKINRGLVVQHTEDGDILEYLREELKLYESFADRMKELDALPEWLKVINETLKFEALANESKLRIFDNGLCLLIVFAAHAIE